MEQDGIALTTINNTRKYLSKLAMEANLDDPAETKLHILKLKISDGHKKILLNAYRRYAQYYTLPFTMPKLQVHSRPIQPPTKEKVDILINSCKAPMCIKLRISAETGLRPIQVYSLEAKNIDIAQRRIYAQSAKNGNPVTTRVSLELINQIAEYMESNHLQPNEKLFKGSQDDYCKHYRAYRNRLAKKLHDPSLKTIRLYDLRHYYGTMEYHRTHDIVHVSRQLGHKNISTTMVYVHLVNDEEDEWISKVAQTADEICKLVEAGYQKADEIDGLHIYRKRK
jgi:integrase